jgi:hypothetical protein
MSEWITDRLPSRDDVDGKYGEVWVFWEHGEVSTRHWSHVAKGQAWQPIHKPAPYVKAKRYTVGWNHNLQVWNMYQDGKPIGVLPRGLSYEDSYYAQRIADYYNKV